MSNLLTDLAGGDLEYSVSMTSLSSFVGISPFLLIFFLVFTILSDKSLVSAISLDTTAMYLDVFTTLGVPLLIGMILKANGDMMEKVAPIIDSVLFQLFLLLVRQNIGPF